MRGCGTWKGNPQKGANCAPDADKGALMLLGTAGDGDLEGRTRLAGGVALRLLLSGRGTAMLPGGVLPIGTATLPCGDVILE